MLITKRLPSRGLYTLLIIIFGQLLAIPVYFITIVLNNILLIAVAKKDNFQKLLILFSRIQHCV